MRSTKDIPEAENLTPEQELERLETAIMAGEPVTPTQLIEARERVTIARLTAQGIAAREDEANAATRLAALKAIHDEIASEANTGGKMLAGLLREAERATTAFIVASETRNAKIATWRSQLRSHAVAELEDAAAPRPEDALTGWTGQEILAGRSVLSPVRTEWRIGEAIGRAATLSGINVAGIPLPGLPMEELYTHLESEASRLTANGAA
ncbi:hypothetical protein BH09ACT6_BH09ACT6_05860 [soil metagenome]